MYSAVRADRGSLHQKRVVMRLWPQTVIVGARQSVVLEVGGTAAFLRASVSRTASARLLGVFGRVTASCCV